MSVKEQSLAEYSVDADGGVHLIYGSPGSGKTVMASTYPAPLRWLDYDEGWDSVLWAMKAGICPHKPEDIRRVVPQDTFDKKGKLVRATGYWQTLDAINYWISDEHIGEWKTLVIDPMTTLNRFAMHAGLEISGTHLRSSGKDKAEPSITTTQRAGIVVWGIQDYRPAQSLFDQILTFNEHSLRKIAKGYNKYVVLLCHVYEKYRAPDRIGDLPNLVGVEPDLMGRHRTDIPKDCDEVYYIRNEGTKKEPEFMVQTISDSFTFAKSRYGCLDMREPADFRKIHAKVASFYSGLTKVASVAG